jgi:putative thiamine transport system permease protein
VDDAHHDRVAATLRPLTVTLGEPDPGSRGKAPRIGPVAVSAVVIAVLAVPVAAGLAGTLLPAFGYLPAVGASTFGTAAWRELHGAPGFGSSLALTLGTGLAATGLSLVLAWALAAVLQGHAAGRRLGAALAPWLAVPHSAIALGLVFLLLPSGWLVRWVSPAWTGWSVPPDVLTVGHPSGWPLVLGLMVKEVPYLLLMTLAALHQVDARRQITMARTLGQRPVSAWVKVVLPQIHRQMRLPVLAVLVFSLTVVDVALVLGPSAPPTLAVMAIRWLADPDIGRLFPGAAAATLLLALGLALIGAVTLGERFVGWLGRRWVESGSRGRGPEAVALAAVAVAAALALLAALAVVALGVWSFADAWRFPHALPTRWTTAHWVRQSDGLWDPLATTVVVATAATALALVLAIALLEARDRLGAARAGTARWDRFMYLPLLVPQVAFLFGAQVLLVRLGLDGTWAAVVWAHLLFTLPYLYLSLADPWRALDPRYVRTAASLGASPARVLWRVKLPILLRPVLVASAVAFAVSVGLYLPTLFAGAGRVATLTTEAVTLATGADRRVIGVWAALQTALPLAVFALAAVLPRWLQPHRRAW